MGLLQPQIQPNGELTARYISQIAHELRIIASKADLAFLAYLLAMVEDEASASATEPGPVGRCEGDMPSSEQPEAADSTLSR